jgi:hypothetical protein
VQARLCLDIRATARPLRPPPPRTSALIRAAGRRHAGRKPWNQMTSPQAFFLFFWYFYKIVGKFRKNSIKT